MEMTKKIRTYSELIEIPTFEDRYRYLRLGNRIGEEAFGFDRYLNQRFYKSREWLAVRNEVIVRDAACDLACEDREIPDGVRILIHHMNPIRIEDIAYKREWILNPDFLICTTKQTHDAIHYGDETILCLDPIERSPNDTCPWR